MKCVRGKWRPELLLFLCVLSLAGFCASKFDVAFRVVYRIGKRFC